LISTKWFKERLHAPKFKQLRFTNVLAKPNTYHQDYGHWQVPFQTANKKRQAPSCCFLSAVRTTVARVRSAPVMTFIANG